MTIKEMIAKYVLYVLEKTEFNYSKARKILKISERTMRNHRQRLKLPVKVGNHEVVMLRTLSPEERDFFENMDSWG
jgi:DNA-binding NtrC family response regulator